jgi:hypothetical protein
VGRGRAEGAVLLRMQSRYLSRAMQAAGAPTEMRESQMQTKAFDVAPVRGGIYFQQCRATEDAFPGGVKVTVVYVLPNHSRFNLAPTKPGLNQTIHVGRLGPISLNRQCGCCWLVLVPVRVVKSFVMVILAQPSSLVVLVLVFEVGCDGWRAVQRHPAAQNCTST